MEALKSELLAAEADVRRGNARLEEARRRLAAAGGGASKGARTIYWDINDGSFASLASEAIGAAFPGAQSTRWTPQTPRLGDRDLLVGFIVILGRLDTRDEDLTKEWADTGRSVVIVTRGPGVGKGRQDWTRPPDFSGIRQQMIHLYASLEGKRVITEGDFHTDFSMYGVRQVWEPESLAQLAGFIKKAAA